MADLPALGGISVKNQRSAAAATLQRRCTGAISDTPFRREFSKPLASERVFMSDFQRSAILDPMPTSIMGALVKF